MTRRSDGAAYMREYRRRNLAYHEENKRRSAARYRAFVRLAEIYQDEYRRLFRLELRRSR